MDFPPNQPNSTFCAVTKKGALLCLDQEKTSVLLMHKPTLHGIQSSQKETGDEDGYLSKIMQGIPKGSILKEVAPYAVVPLYTDAATHSDVANVGSKNSRIGTDPTHVPGLENLPKWKDCSIWNQRDGKHISETPEVKKYLRRARRMVSSSGDNVVGSWRILCILAVLRVIEDNTFDEQKSFQTDLHHHESNGAKAPWWSDLASEHFDDEFERAIGGRYEDDDDDGSLLVELWPLIREHIPWIPCQRLYQRIQNRLHVITIAHPLKAWAQKTLFELTNDEFETSWKIFQSAKSETTSGVPNRLRASKLWLDLVANIPDRLVGVLVDDPSKIEHEQEPKRESTALSLPRSYQSCLPNTCLELHTNDATEKAIENIEAPTLLCKWIALYDLSSTESEITNRTLSTMPKPIESDFFDAQGNSKTPSPKINVDNLAQARRLAHSHFFKEAFEDAMSLYQECHDYCSSSEGTETDKTSTTLQEWKFQNQADLWHAIGAVILSQQKFASAQEHWKNGSRYQSVHKEISEQLEKQTAYQYFDELSPHKRKGTFKQEILQSQTNAMTTSNKSIFVSSDVIEIETCRQLIEWAKEYALDHGGWTASRHYAVPTTDLPIHKVPKLLRWFQEWMPNVLFPLLQDQFGASSRSAEKKRFYVHDAFLVRYEATASSNFLPMHFDESTHSCVLALNDDFDGGGSYIYDLDRSIAPETGGMVSFRGNQCLHGGNPVTRGVRYILAIFLFLDRDLACDSSEDENRIKEEENKEKESNLGTKRKDEETSKESIAVPKRSKIVDGVQSDQSGEGFSFSFF